MGPELETSRLTLDTLLKRAQGHSKTTAPERATFVLEAGDWSTLTTCGEDIERWGVVEKRRNLEILLGAFVGFLQCAVEGYAFVPTQRIQERYGGPLKDTYPGASASFLKFATSYWTLKIVYLEQRLAHPTMALSYFLEHLDTDIAAIFFPTPGPLKVPHHEREQKQRQVLSDFAPKGYIEDFINGNPILASERTESSGCRRSGVAGLFFCALLVLLLTMVKTGFSILGTSVVPGNESHLAREGSPAAGYCPSFRNARTSAGYGGDELRDSIPEGG